MIEGHAVSDEIARLIAGVGATSPDTLRLFPGKRWVGRVILDGKPALLKLFLHSARGGAHCAQEQEGARALMDAQIPTPALLKSGKQDGIPYLVYEWMADAETVRQRIRTGPEADILPLVKKMVELTARLHDQRLLQQDLHLENFLVQGQTLYAIDADQIRQFRDRMPDATRLDNLALLLAQLPARFLGEAPALIHHYYKRREADAVESWPEFKSRLERAIFLRGDKFRRKALRTSTRFQAFEHQVPGGYLRGVFDKQAAVDGLEDLLRDPDQPFQCAPDTWLKAGNSASVNSIEIGAQSLIVKRYNVKSLWHGIKRQLKASRAQTSWQFGLYLNHLGIDSPAPLAYIERRRAGLKREAWLITRAVDGQSARAWFAAHTDDDQTMEAIARQLQSFHHCRLVHGDTKATNILITDPGPTWIDLDAVRAFAPDNLRFEAAFRKDMRRFVRNWQESPQLVRTCDRALAAVGLAWTND